MLSHSIPPIFALIGCILFATIGWQIAGNIRFLLQRSRSLGRLLLCAVCLFAAICLWGLVGFSAQWITATKAFHLSSQFNWPAGTVHGAVLAPDGRYLVPLPDIGRIQVYDAQLNFLYGWNLETRSKTFSIAMEHDGAIRVVDTYHHVSRFREDGIKLESRKVEDLPEETSEPSASNGSTLQIPTSPPLLVFSSPLIASGVFLFGGLALAGFKKMV